MPYHPKGTFYWVPTLSVADLVLSKLVGSVQKSAKQFVCIYLY